MRLRRPFPPLSTTFDHFRPLSTTSDHLDHYRPLGGTVSSFVCIRLPFPPLPTLPTTSDHSRPLPTTTDHFRPLCGTVSSFVRLTLPFPPLSTTFEHYRPLGLFVRFELGWNSRPRFPPSRHVPRTSEEAKFSRQTTGFQSISAQVRARRWRVTLKVGRPSGADGV